MSITYTTLTDIIAFYLGAISSLPAIEAFCYYAATTVLINFLFQITMFSALLVLDAKRMNSQRYDCCCCFPTACCCTVAAGSVGSNDGDVSMSNVVPPASKGDSIAGQYEVVVSEPEPHGAVKEEEEGAVASAPPAAHKELSEGALTSKELNGMQKFFRDYYAPFITTPAVRVIIIACFCLLLAFGIYGTTLAEQGFEVIDFAPDGSYVREYFFETRRLNLDILEQNTPVEIVYKQIDYTTQSNQMEMLRVQERFLEGSHNKGPFTSWISDFTTWVNTADAYPYNNSVNADGYLVDPDLYYDAVELFLTQDAYTRFDRDIIFINTTEGDPSTLAIDASRVSAFHIDMNTAMRQVRAMEFARDVVDEASIAPKPLVFAPSYINIETELVIVNEMIFNLAFALIAVVIVSSFILIRPAAVVLVGLFVAMIDVELIGLLHFWALKINSVTVVQLVMAVGLVVDYVSHVIHYYLAQPFDRSPDERLKACLVEIGPSVLLGCSTTFLGTMPLAFANSVIFRTFFKCFFLIISLGGLHGLVLLPVVLPLIPFEDISHYLVVAQDEKVGVLEEGAKIQVTAGDEADEQKKGDAADAGTPAGVTAVEADDATL
mmetsp:Transcript_22470/g.37797  ORF Transcript_22470/g.37797 Transcript_22470/m.37797 type:complete len:605 (-) Transcript_22470:1098-2912(-)